MLNAAQRMKALGKRSSVEAAPASIFGSALTLAAAIDQDEAFRIALYPIVADHSPDAAMGLAACLGYLLDQQPSCRVYRCFARIDEDDDSGEISSDDYQFSPDDWLLEGLDDNVLLSGDLSSSGEQLSLNLALDLSLIGKESASLEYRGANLAELCSQLPQIARDILSRLTQSAADNLILTYTRLKSDRGVDGLLELVFGWNLDLYLNLWGVAWVDDDIVAQFDEVESIASASADDFAYWCLGMMSLQLTQPGLEELEDAIFPLISHGLRDGATETALAAVAVGLGNLDQFESAMTVLDLALGDGAPAGVWYAAADIALDAGLGEDAVDICQRALETGLEHPVLYEKYAELLMMAEANEWQIEDVLLVDPDEVEEERQITWEIIGALKRVSQLAPGNFGALVMALSHMIDIDDSELWVYFERLVERDSASDFVPEVIDSLADIPDLAPAFEILGQRAMRPGASANAIMQFAQLALVDENHELAERQLRRCRELHKDIDDDLELELQRLELGAALPDFEAQVAEMKVMLNARRVASESQVDALEKAIEIAPRLVDLHLLLSRCYAGWGDDESAMEVLREGSQSAGAHPRLSQCLAQLQWKARDAATAVETLNAGLRDFPNDVGLLSQMAAYLIENSQLDDARGYIERAESIAPTHQALWQLRHLIAEKVAP